MIVHVLDEYTLILMCDHSDACYGKQCLIDGDCRFSTDSLMCECDVGKIMNENDECVGKLISL